MERVPVFMYDRVNGICDLMFIDKQTHTLHIADNAVKGKSNAVRIVPTTDSRPHLMIVHYDGEDFRMVAVDDVMIKNIKSFMFTRELINKFVDRKVPTSAKYKRRGPHGSSGRVIASRLRNASLL